MAIMLCGSSAFVVTPSGGLRGSAAAMSEHRFLRKQGQPPVLRTAMSGSGRGDDAVVFMPGKSAENFKDRSTSKRFEQFYSSTGVSGEASQDGQDTDSGDDEGEPVSRLDRLLHSTERSLDWHVVRATLANCSVTTMGRAALETMEPFREVSEVERAFNALAEVRALAEQGVNLPVSRVHDIVKLSGSAGKGEILDLPELKDCAGTLVAMQEISQLLDGRNDTTTLSDIAQDIDLDPEVVRLFERSFDASGQLSIRQYPQLDQLRKEIIQIESSVT